MADTKKTLTIKDFEQSIRQSHNNANGTLGVDGFLVGLIGRQIKQTTSTTNVANDTVIFDFYEDFGATLLYEITLVYTDATQKTLLTATRTA